MLQRPAGVGKLSDASPVRRDDAWLRVLLVRILRDQGLGSLCKGEPSTYEEFSSRMSIVLMSGFGLGLVFTISDWMNANTFGTILIGAALALALGIAGMKIGVSSAAMILVSAWIACLVVQLLLTD